MAAKFELKSAKGGKFLFNLKSPNGQVVITSELYDTKKAAEKGIESVRKGASNEKRFETKAAKNGEQYFVIKAANGEPISTSQRYKTKRGVVAGMASVQKNAPEARVEDLTTE